MPKRRSTTSLAQMTVQRTVSLPLGLVNDINSEALLTGKGFSKTLQLLITIGLDRQEQLRDYEEQQKKADSTKREQEDLDRLRKMQEASRTA